MPSTPRPTFTPNKAPTPSTASELKVQRSAPKAASFAQPIAQPIAQFAPPATSTEAKAPPAPTAPPATALELREQPKIVRTQSATEQLLERTAGFASKLTSSNRPKPTIGDEVDGPLVQTDTIRRETSSTPIVQSGDASSAQAALSETKKAQSAARYMSEEWQRERDALDEYQRTHVTAAYQGRVESHGTTVQERAIAEAERAAGIQTVWREGDPVSGAAGSDQVPIEEPPPNLLPFLLMLLFGGL